MKNIYTSTNSEYLQKNPDWHVSDSPWKARQVHKILEKNKINFTTIVEIGCGAGEILNQLTFIYPNSNLKFSGFEIAPDAFQYCLTRQKHNLNFYQDNLLETNLFFDVLLSMDVFEHVDNYIDFIKRCGQKATFKIYHIPLDISVLGIMRDVPLSARKSVKHLHYFSKDTAIESLKYCEQEIIDYFYTPVMIEVHNKKLSTKILNVFRKFFFKINPDLCVKYLGGYSLIVLTK